MERNRGPRMDPGPGAEPRATKKEKGKSVPTVLI